MIQVTIINKKYRHQTKEDKSKKKTFPNNKQTKKKKTKHENTRY